MTSFDPVAATAAHLAALSPAQVAKAIAYTQGGHWLVLGEWLVTMAIAVILVRSGLLVKLRAGVEAKGKKPILAGLVVFAVFGLLAGLLSVPWDAYARWWREGQYGLTSQPFAGWLTEEMIRLAISVVIQALFLMLLYALIRRAPKTWWLWAAGLLAGFTALIVLLSPVVIEPLFNSYKPAPPGLVRDTVVAMARQVNVPSDKIYIYDGSKQSNRYTANVSGLGASARVAMSDVMFKKGADVAEIRGVVGHEMGHYAHMHVLWFILAQTLMAFLAFWLVQALFPITARLLGAAGVSGIADPAGVPVLMAVIATLTLLGTPLNSTFTRLAEADADHFSVTHFNEPDGLAKALVKTAEYRAPNPSAIEEVVFYDHPSVGHRVRAAMDYKAAHYDAVAAQEAKDVEASKALAAGQ